MAWVIALHQVNNVKELTEKNRNYNCSHGAVFFCSKCNLPRESVVWCTFYWLLYISKISQKMHERLCSSEWLSLLFRWHWHQCQLYGILLHTHTGRLISISSSFFFKCRFVHKLIRSKALILWKSSHQFYPFKLFMYERMLCTNST